MSTPARCPAILIAAPASGQGKTTVTAALARLHSRAGRRVRVFKCGPDFLDPFWHQLASGAPVHQVDLWMTGEADVRARLHAAAQQADVILVEGVMGLFDGQPSAADRALRMGLPGDLLLVFADALTRTWKQIIRFKPEGDLPTPAPRVETPALESNLDEQLVAAMEGVVRDERGLRFEREESD